MNSRFSSFRGGASGLKVRGVPTLSRKRDASRPERKPTRAFATTMLHHTLPPASAVRPQVARSTGRSSPALNGGFVDPEGRPVGGAHKTPRRANRGRKPHQSPTLNERDRKAERSRVGSVTGRRSTHPTQRGCEPDAQERGRELSMNRLSDTPERLDGRVKCRFRAELLAEDVLVGGDLGFVPRLRCVDVVSG